MHIEGGYSNYPNEWIWFIPIPPKPSCPEKSPIVTEPAKKVPSAPLPAKNRNDNRFQYYISCAAHDLSEFDIKYISYRLKIDLNLHTLFSTGIGFNKVNCGYTDAFAQFFSANSKAYRTEYTNLTINFEGSDRHKVSFAKREEFFLSFLSQNYCKYHLDFEISAELNIQSRLVYYIALLYLVNHFTLSDTLAPALLKGRVNEYNKMNRKTKYRMAINEVHLSKGLYSLNKKHIQNLVYEFKECFMILQSFDSKVCYVNKDISSSELLELLFNPSTTEVRLINFLWMEQFIIQKQNQKHQGQCPSMSSCRNSLQYDLLKRIRRVYILKNLKNNSEEIGDCISHDAHILSFFDTYENKLLTQCCAYGVRMIEEEILKGVMLHSFRSLNIPYYKVIEVYLTFKCYLKDKLMMKNTAVAKTTINYNKSCTLAKYHFVNCTKTSNYLTPVFHEYMGDSNEVHEIDIISGSYLLNYPKSKNELIDASSLSKVTRLKVLRESLRTKKHLVRLFNTSAARSLNVSDQGRRSQHKKLVDVGHLSPILRLNLRNKMH